LHEANRIMVIQDVAISKAQRKQRKPIRRPPPITPVNTSELATGAGADGPPPADREAAGNDTMDALAEAGPDATLGEATADAAVTPPVNAWRASGFSDAMLLESCGAIMSARERRQRTRLAGMLAGSRLADENLPPRDDPNPSPEADPTVPAPPVELSPADQEAAYSAAMDASMDAWMDETAGQGPGIDDADVIGSGFSDAMLLKAADAIIADKARRGMGPGDFPAEPDSSGGLARAARAAADDEAVETWLDAEFDRIAAEAEVANVARRAAGVSDDMLLEAAASIIATRARRAAQSKAELPVPRG